jgi:type II secretory pathway pseudopilin PulG
MNRLRRRTGADGFTLMEAIVAMSIVAGALTTILALQAQLVSDLSAIERSATRAAWRLNVVEVAAAQMGAEPLRSPLSVGPAEIAWSDNGAPLAEGLVRVGQKETGRWTVTIAPVEFRVTQGGRTVLVTNQRVTRARQKPAATN